MILHIETFCFSFNLSGITDAVSNLFNLFNIELQDDNYEKFAFSKEKKYEEKQRQQKVKIGKTDLIFT